MGHFLSTIKHSHPICIWYTNSSRRREIQINSDTDRLLMFYLIHTGEYNKAEICKMAASCCVEVTDKEISKIKVEVKSVCYILNCCIFLNDVLSEYLTPFWFVLLLNEYEIEFMFRKIWNIRNLGNVYIRGPHIVMSRTDAQNGFDFHFKIKSVPKKHKWLVWKY
jgi:hypothetical protein